MSAVEDIAEPANDAAADAAKDAHAKTARVLFMPSGKRGDFAVGTPVLEAARQLGVYVESVCGGRGICGRCQVDVATGQFAKHGITSAPENISEFGAKEQRYAEKRDLKAGRRLSCSSTVQGDLVIDIPQDVAVNAQVVRKAADNRIIERDPATTLCYVEVEEPDMEKPLGDLDRLFVALETEWGITGIRADAHLLPRIQTILRKGQWKVTCAIHDDGTGRGAELVSVWPGFHNEAYGLAVDIGSTTIAAHLVSLLSGRVVASSGISNPQIRFGEDLMSRVSYVMMNPDGREGMTVAVREALNEVAGKLAEEGGVERSDILEGVFVANPVMHHLFLGIDPTELGGAPFALAASGALHLKASDLGLDLNDGARAYILPCIAGHVGADAAGVALSEAPQKDDALTLVVDVGTNAEIVLGNSHRLVAASSPTGPAFEGAEISCGQRAAPGGIERLRIDPDTLEPRFRVIGSELWSDEDGFSESVAETGITGIVGSGIIEAIAEMFLAGILSTDGVVDGSLAARSDRIVPHGRTFAYVVHTASEFGGAEQGGVDITITQTDVRAIQLAKAALYAGVRLLMEKLDIETVDKVKLAGAFGSYIEPKYAMVLGLIPDCTVQNVSSVGNAAGTGARMALLNRGHRREIEQLVQDIEKIETALEPRFQEHFVNAMGIPNRTETFPKLGEVVTLPAPRFSSGDESGGTDGEGGRRRRRRRDAYRQ